MLKVKDNSSLVRDPVSKAIINIDETGYEAYVSKRERLRKEKEQTEKNSRDIEILKNDISDIKSMLKMLLNVKEIK